MIMCCAVPARIHSLNNIEYVTSHVLSITNKHLSIDSEVIMPNEIHLLSFLKENKNIYNADIMNYIETTGIHMGLFDIFQFFSFISILSIIETKW